MKTTSNDQGANGSPKRLRFSASNEFKPDNRVSPRESTRAVCKVPPSVRSLNDIPKQIDRRTFFTDANHPRIIISIVETPEISIYLLYLVSLRFCNRKDHIFYQLIIILDRKINNDYLPSIFIYLPYVL